MKTTANALTPTTSVRHCVAAAIASGRAARWLLAGTLAFHAGLAAAAAPETSETADDELEVLEETVVTGTVIRREDDAALPVTVVTAEELDLREGGSPVDLLTSMPTISNVPLNESAQGGAGSRGDIAAVSLRGLGSGSTLLLLNGRRMAAHGITSTEDSVPVNSVNANVLPARGLSRVDVLRDGASSIYGSDAVAGVVNFVVDTNYRGTELEVAGSFNEISSGDDRRVTLTHGGYYAGDRLHWITTFDWFDRDETTSLDIAGDSNKTAIAPAGFNSLTGPFFDRNASSQYPAFRIGTATATRYLVPTASGAAFSTTVPARDGQFASQSYFDVNNGYALPESTRFNWFNQVDFKLTENVTVFGEALGYKAKSTMVRDPIAYSTAADRAITLAVANPFNPYGSRYYSPTGAPNTDGTPRVTGTPQTTTVTAYRFVDNGPETVDIDTEAFRLLAGVRGTIAGRWNWESAAGVSKAQTDDISKNGLRESLVLAAIAAGQYNPFGYNFAVQGGAVVPTTPYVNDATVREGFTQDFEQYGHNTLWTADARIGGALFDIWSGSIQGAVGVEHRWDDYELYRPQFHGYNYANSLGLDPTNNDFIRASPAGDIYGQRKVFGAFAETVVPLASPGNEFPLVYSLSLGASVRHERYDDFGSTTKPKFTIDYRPVEAVMIRGSYNEGFRAPTLAAANYPTRGLVSSYNDPYRQPVTGLPSDGNFSRLQTTSGNPNLTPELSKGVTLGVVVDVPWVTGVHFSVDYYKIEQDDIIAAPSDTALRNSDAVLLREATQAALAAGTPINSINLGSGTADYQGNPQVVRAAVNDTDRALFAAYNATRPQSQWVAPVGALIDTRTTFSNLDSSEISGLDFNIGYRLPAMSWGRLNFSLDWSHILKYSRVGGTLGDVSTRVGINSNPKKRGTANLTWSLGTWSAGASGYYIGSYADQAAPLTETAYQALTDKSYVATVAGLRYFKVDKSMSFNAFVAKEFTSNNAWLDGISARLGVRNLTNEKPPLSSANAGYDASVYNSVAAGRGWTARLSKSF